MTTAALESITSPEVLRSMFRTAASALLVIDVQVDFAAPDGAMARFGADLSGVEPCLDRIADLIAVARARGMLIGWLRVATSAATDSAAARRFYARRGFPPQALEVCREGERGAEYYRLTPRPGDLEIAKRQYSGFVGTDLDVQLRARGIGTVFLCGLTTECCVDCTARDGYQRDYDVFIVSDACAAYDAATHRSALDNLSKNCALLAETTTVLHALAVTPG